MPYFSPNLGSTRPDEVAPDPMDLYWPGFQQWLVGLASVRFDLEQGQVIEDCFPKGAISPEEEIDIAFSSFPDSMSSVHNKASLHDCVFFFRIRRRGTATFKPPIREHRTPAGPRAISVKNPSPSMGGVPLDSWSRSRTEPSAALTEHMTHAGQRQVDNPAYKSPELRTIGTEPCSTTSPSTAQWGPAGSRSPFNLPQAADSSVRTSGSSRSAPELSGGVQPTMNNRSAGNTSVASLHTDGATDFALGPTRYLYGFVFNRQRHDERLPRGGEQKSVVVLSERPYSSVFRQLAQVVGPLYFDYGNVALVQVSHAVAQWPKPILGASMELSVGHSVIRAQLPPSHTLPPTGQTPLDDFTAAMAPAPRNNSISQGIFHEADLFGMCKGILMQLWVLWELLLIGEPLLVLAPTPAQSSEAVAALVGLIAPLPCSLDFRPYFTIHDPDFPALSMLKDGDPIPPMILGVTNLFFLRAMKCLPHVLSVGRPVQGNPNMSGPPKSSGMIHPNSQVSTREPRARLAVPLPAANALQSMAASTIFSVIAAGTRGLSRLRREGPLSLMTEHREALWTNYTPIAKADTSILNRLVDPSTGPLGNTASTGSNSLGSTGMGFLPGVLMGGGSGDLFGDPSMFPASASGRSAAEKQSLTLSMINNEILRRHFVEVTTNFLAPFGPFLRASTPPEGASPFQDPPPLPPFDAVEFLKQLSSRGPGKFLAKRLNPNTWLDLYRRFLEGPNFMPWFQRRRAVAEGQQRRLWCRAREKADIRRFLQTMDEGSLLEAFHALERHISTEMQIPGASIESPLIMKLRGDMRAVFNEMPRDMQQRILFNPEYASLLQGGRSPAMKPPGKPLLFSQWNDQSRAKSAEKRPLTADQVRRLGGGQGQCAPMTGANVERHKEDTWTVRNVGSVEETLGDKELPGRIKVARQSLLERFSAVGESYNQGSVSHTKSANTSPWETPPWVAQSQKQRSGKRPGNWVAQSDSGEVVVQGRMKTPEFGSEGGSVPGDTGTDGSENNNTKLEEQSPGGVFNLNTHQEHLVTVRSDSQLHTGQQESNTAAELLTPDSPWGGDLWSFARRGWGFGGGLAPSHMTASAPTTPSAYGDFTMEGLLPPRTGSAKSEATESSAFRPRGRSFGLSAAARWTAVNGVADPDDDVFGRGPLNPSPFNPLV